jgi:putative addiction module killer protein
MRVKEARETESFKQWLKKLKDLRGKAIIYKRIERLSEGNPGDSAPIGAGLSEMRIRYGPGYRVYYKDTGKEIIILLCGGDKSTQEADIVKAKELAKELIDEKAEEERDENN